MALLQPLMQGRIIGKRKAPQPGQGGVAVGQQPVILHEVFQRAVQVVKFTIEPHKWFCFQLQPGLPVFGQPFFDIGNRKYKAV